MDRKNNNNHLIGLYEKALPDDLSLEDKLSMIGRAGYSFMEISIDSSKERLERLKWDNLKIKKFRDLIQESEIPVISLCLSANRDYPIGSSFKELRDKGMEIMEGAIWFAFHTGIRIIQVAGYDELMDKISTTKTRETYLNNLKKSIELASRLGVLLAIENVDVLSADSIRKILYFVNKIRSPWLNIYPDVGNLYAMKQDVLKELKLGKDHIVAIHIKDTLEGVVRRVPYGEGNVDFISIFKELKKFDYHGLLLLEMWANNDRDNYKIISDSKKWIEYKMEKAGYL